MAVVTCKYYIGICLAMVCISFNAFALDTIKILRPQWDIASYHSSFKDVLIKRSMEVTKEEYGPYEFIINPLRMNRSRSLVNIIKGETHNLYITPSHPEWDQQTIAIKIPIRLGLLSYRLLLIHKDDLELFSKINTLEQLKKLTAGLRSKWVTTQIFKKEKFTMVESANYDGLFNLLDKHKFHYFPRSIYEIYDELSERTQLYKNLVIEPTLALNIPTATYVYISPKNPRLAKRITDGLTRLFDSGELTEIVEKYYGAGIKKAQLPTRKIIEIENPFYLDADRLKDQKYLYQP